MTNLEYTTKTSSRFRLNSESALCIKIHSDEGEMSFSNYALIPLEKSEDASRRYRAMVDEG